jgi:hypothetical protein
MRIGNRQLQTMDQTWRITDDSLRIGDQNRDDENHGSARNAKHDGVHDEDRRPERQAQVNQAHRWKDDVDQKGDSHDCRRYDRSAFDKRDKTPKG